MAGEESIGTARIDVVVDTSDMEPKISSAKRKFSDLSADAQRQLMGMDSANKRLVEGLDKQVNKVGKTREEWLRYQIVTKTTGAVQDELLRKLTQNTAAIKTQEAAIGASAKANAAALRQLPMQFTDIFTSLATGQKPMYVLLQQGGQLKDVFGGVGNALKASASYLAGLINPVTIAAAAVGGLALAWKSASDAQFEYQKALILSGNYAGKTVDEVKDLVDQLDRLSGVARGSATSAVLQTAQSGRFSGEQFDLVAEAAARMESSVGVSVDKTIAKFEAIAKDPVDALLKLNDTEHFLTRAHFDRIRALEEEGHTQDAVAEAVRIYSDHLDDVARQSNEVMPAMSRWWRDLKDEISSAGGEIQTYITLIDRAIARQGELRAMGGGEFSSRTVVGTAATTALPGLGFVPDWATNPSLVNALAKSWLGTQAAQPISHANRPRHGPGRTAADAALAAGEGKAILDAEKEWGQLRQQNLSQEAKRLEEVNKAKELGKKLGYDQAKIDEQIAAINERYASKKSKQANTDNNSAATLIESIQRQITANEQLVQTGEKVSASDRLGITARQLLADKTNTMTAATRKLIEALLPQLKASDDAAEALEKQKNAAEALARQSAILEAQTKSRARSNELDLMQYGHGSDAVEQLRRQLEIHRAYEDELKRIGDKGVAKDKAEWDRLAGNAAKFRDEQLALERQYQEDRLAAIGDWRNGVNAAMEDYLANTRNIAAQTYEVFSGMTDALQGTFEEFFRTGKLDWKGFLDDVNAEIARFVSQQLVRQILGGASGGGTEGGLSGLFGLIFGASDSYTGFAKGGVFGGSPGLSKYSSQVVTTPTVFAFARGAGLMGEAGPEAIMPLRRLPSGRLGVETVSAGPGNSAPPIVQNISNNFSERVDRRSRSAVESAIWRATSSAAARR